MSDFHGMTGTIGNAAAPGFGKGGFAKVYVEPATERTEYAIMYANGDIMGTYDTETSAARTLFHERAALGRMGVPEEYWPVLHSRVVETTVGSWRPLSE